MEVRPITVLGHGSRSVYKPVAVIHNDKCTFAENQVSKNNTNLVVDLQKNMMLCLTVGNITSICCVPCIEISYTNQPHVSMIYNPIHS